MNYFKQIFLTLIFVTSISNASQTSCNENLTISALKIGNELFKKEQYLLATQLYSISTASACTAKDLRKSRLAWSLALFELEETSLASDILMKTTNFSKIETQQSQIIQAWYQPQLRENLDSSVKLKFTAYEKELELLPQVKKPWVAGTLSAILPGSGQIYNSNYESAAFSFALNALFLAATIELNRKKLNSTATLSGVMFSIVYFGNIVNSVQSSKKINDQANETSKVEIKKSYFPELNPEHHNQQ